MRLVTALLPLFFYSIHTTAQHIDSLQTDEAVIAFLQKNYPHKVQFSSKPTKRAIYPYYDSVGRRNYPAPLYAKADFDHNGYTDLLFNGYLDTSPDSKSNGCYPISWIVLTLGNDSFTVKELSYYDHHAFFFAARPVMVNGQPLIETMLYKNEYNPKTRNSSMHKQKDTMVYAFGEFIEKRKNATDSIEQIRFCYSPGMSFSSPFTLIINRDSVTWEKEYELTSGLDELPGSLSVAPLDSVRRVILFGLLTAINFKQLHPIYHVSWTCDATTYLQVVYNNGKVKMIEDYGLLGTKGLHSLYYQLMELQDRLAWTAVKKIEGRLIFRKCF